MTKTQKKEFLFIEKVIKYAIMFASAAFISMLLAYFCKDDNFPSAQSTQGFLMQQSPIR